MRARPARPRRLVRLVDGKLAASVTLDAQLTGAATRRGSCERRHLRSGKVDTASADEIRGRCYVATTGFAQGFELAFVARSDGLTVHLNARALPLTGGAAPQMVATAIDIRFRSGERWFALTEQPRYRYLPSATLCAEAQVAGQRLHLRRQGAGLRLAPRDARRLHSRRLRGAHPQPRRR